jgi:subtilisin family serine protease
MKKALVLALLLMMTVGLATAGTVSPGLESQMRSMTGDDEIKVLVVMKDQVNIRSLDWELHDAKSTREARHLTVLNALQTTAKNSQGSLLADLSNKAAAGQVRGYTPHWLINSVVVVTTVDGVRELAQRSDVDVIEPDLVVELIEPVQSEKQVDKDGRGVGITPGVVAVGARRVWDELGIDGTGVIVGVLDTGVDGTHPSLSARWRGNFAPADECWLDAADLGDATPVDQHYHGTHVMGTITGLAADDTIGVAPGAQWIASNVINMGSGTAFDNAVIASLEFMTDPDGDPGTTDDVPDVVQNSWGVNESFSGYVDCDSRWWTAIDACEAAGVVLTWSAGNEGSGSQTLRSPADRATDAYNAFSVGSTIANSPYTISSFSSRGPSGCGGSFATKPEISAPGSDIYSAQPGGGYQLLSGTSMAGPHVAGVVALMRAANPGLDVITIKQILMDTSVDLGTAGEDNDYGHGFVNAYDAVLAVMQGFGTVAGTVTDLGNGNPISGATVIATASGEVTRTATTDASGDFQIMLPELSWTLDYSAFGYTDNNQVITILADQTVNGDMALTSTPVAVLSGYVRDDSAVAVVGATVTAVGTPIAPATTDGTGFYQLTLPTGATYDVLAQNYGMGSDQHSVVFSGATSQDFVLPELIFDNFESNSFNQFAWSHADDAPWVIDTSVVFEGTHSARSGSITDSQASTLTIDLNVLATGNLEFEYKVSSESTYDFLRFIVDGVEVDAWSGEVDWSHYTHNLTAGMHTVSWSYTKDSSVSTGSDYGWIDYVIFPTVTPPTYADIAVAPALIDNTLAPGATSQHVITVDNVGEAVLTFNAAASENLPSVVLHDTVVKPKGLQDDQFAPSPALGDGGPDGYGYFWIDEDAFGGPTFDWIDISGVGTAQTFSDDDNQSFGFSFPFNFYGLDYTSVNVCSNGWISFNSTSTSYSNTGIPATADPNNMIAVFWDDLNPASAGTIYTYDDTANNRFIVQWDGVPHYGTSDYLDFQVILNADGTIVCQYLTVLEPGMSTVGLENSGGTDGLQVVNNSAFLEDGKAVVFSLNPAPGLWLSVDPISGSVPAAGTTQLTVTLDASALAEGTYSGNITIASNDPDEPVVVVPVSLTVATVSGIGDETPTRFALVGAYPNPFNPRTEIAFAVPAGGAQVHLDIFDVSGRLVKRLVSGSMEAGNHTVVWSGLDQNHRHVASGTYFYRLSSGLFHETKSMVLLK